MTKQRKGKKPVITKEHDASSNKQDKDIRLGVVTEALPNTMFRLEMEDGSEHIALLKGKMKLHRIRVLVGDKVEVEMEPYGGKGRIIKRL